MKSAGAGVGLGVKATVEIRMSNEFIQADLLKTGLPALATV